MKPVDLIRNALVASQSATSAQIAERTGLHIRKTAAVINQMVLKGEAFIVGKSPISLGREVCVYSTVNPQATGTARKATWLTPLGGACVSAYNVEENQQ